MIKSKTKTKPKTLAKLLGEYLIFFIIYAMIGWIYEVVLETFIYRWGFSNRGVLFGPWLPVYGFGALAFISIWYKLIKDKSLKRKLLFIPIIFLGTMTTATLIELITSYLCEWTLGSWPWQTYADYKINFQARIALSPSIRFGIGGVAFLYLIQPYLDKLVAKLDDKKLRNINIVITSLLASDLVYSLILK